MEQLHLPMFTVAVDLFEGEPVVREVGDATMSVLESINLPPLSLPIFQSNRAPVDGGLLNNIPANVLVAKGFNFVIASSVTAMLEKDFLGIRSNGGFAHQPFLLDNSGDHATEHDSRLQHELRWGAASRLCGRS